MTPREESLSRRVVEKLLLWHLWACVPFALPWMLLPGIFGHRPQAASEVSQMRILLLLVGVSLAIRTWISIKDIKGLPWTYLWPLLDVAFITAAARIGYAQPDSWIIALYVLPVLQAAATLDVRWSMAVAIVAAIACGSVSGFDNLIYSYFLFRLFLLLIVASLVTRLARGLVRARSRLELANYRSELASEMHDGLQQYLGAIAMRLEVAESQAKQNPDAALQSATSAKQIARQASDELRLMLHRLRSPLLERSTLEEALRFQAALFGERSSVPIEVRVSGKPVQLTPKQEHNLLRIAQEALTNVAKHAEAGSAEVHLEYLPDEVVLQVADDGKGIPAGLKPAGMGMETMENRARSIDGALLLKPGPQKGTVVEVRIPLPAAA